jgi:hypothetical protein
MGLMEIRANNFLRLEWFSSLDGGKIKRNYYLYEYAFEIFKCICEYEPNVSLEIIATFSRDVALGIIPLDYSILGLPVENVTYAIEKVKKINDYMCKISSEQCIAKPNEPSTRFVEHLMTV